VAFAAAFLAVLIILTQNETTDAAGRPQAQPSSSSDTAPEGLRAIRQAQALCNLLDRTGVTTAPCEVGPMSIIMHSAISIPQARSICTSTASRMREAN
jgi:hypothetical protein